MCRGENLNNIIKSKILKIVIILTVCVSTITCILWLDYKVNPLTSKMEEKIAENTTEYVSGLLEDECKIRMILVNEHSHYDVNSKFLAYMDTSNEHYVVLVDKRGIPYDMLPWYQELNN